MNPIQLSKSKDRVAIHTQHREEAEKIYLKVQDDVYINRFDYEEISARNVGNALRKRYQVLNIPFLVYGVNKGDVVEIDKNGIVTRTLTDDGQYGYRIAFSSTDDSEETHQYIDDVLHSLNDEGFETEMFNHKISAVNAINAEEAARLETLLRKLVEEAKITGFDTVR